ncbi:MAG: NAD(P)H-binding protein [Pseudomonadota bacterium]
MRILLLGATGTIGSAAAQALLKRGHEVICPVRAPKNRAAEQQHSALAARGAQLRFADVTDRADLAKNGLSGEGFDALVSCLASRTGVAGDARRVDYQANADALELGQAAGITQMVLVSAICVQKPKLDFQHAKLAFEEVLINSGVTYSIVRPTAFFKSLCGQVERVKAGKSFKMFGDGLLTACKPISDADLADYIARCLDDESLKNKILPIGGPGEAISPKQQADYLFAATGHPPHYKSVAPGLLLKIAKVLSVLAKLYPPLKVKAEYARIGYYYATESMLVLDPETGDYRADLTPSTGTQTLFQHYDALLRQEK